MDITWRIGLQNPADTPYIFAHTCIQQGLLIHSLPRAVYMGQEKLNC